MINHKTIKQILAAALILTLFGVILYGLWPYLDAMLGAFVLFVIFRPLTKWLVRHWRLRPALAALLVLFLSVLLILAPLSFLASILVKEAQIALTEINNFLGGWSGISKFLPDFDLANFDSLPQAGSAAGKFIFGTLSAIGGQAISFIIMYFLFYFLLVADEIKMTATIYSIMPFSEANTRRLMLELRKVTYTTLLTSGLISLLQGAFLALGLWYFGVGAPVLWGLVAAMCALVPMIGTPVVWLPAAIVKFATGDIFAAVGILVWGAIVASGDNLLRPYLQKKFGQIHPFISLLGVIMGLSLFGLVGLIIGPLLLSYFLLMLRMFKEEYVE